MCACPPPCEPVLRPVCGSDSRTHDSECELQRAACLLGRELRVLHAGACGKKDGIAACMNGIHDLRRLSLDTFLWQIAIVM